MVALGVALPEVEESYCCRFEHVLSTGQTWLRVEGTDEQHAKGEGVGRSQFWAALARKKGEKHCGESRRLSAGGRTRRRMISGLEFLPL